MKKKLIISTVVIALLISGCSSMDAKKVVISASEASVQSEASVSSPIKKENDKEVFRELGEVTKIVGNEVTLKMIKIKATTEMVGDSNNTESVKKSTGQKRFSGGNSQVGKKVKIEYTGEISTLIIPVGTPIYSRSMNGQELVDLEEITSGSKLTLIYNSDQQDKIISDRIINKITLIKGR